VARSFNSRATNRVVAIGGHRTNPIDVLARRFPVVRQLVGASSFRDLARRFVLGEPPGIPIPHTYGENLPRFLRALGGAASIQYVADIAELEAARCKSRHAAPAQPLDARALALLRSRRLDGLQVALHPSVCLVQSRFPIVTIWENNRHRGQRSTVIERWSPEAALVARPFGNVEVRRLPPGGYAFCLALARGQIAATAAHLAAAATPGFALATNWALLMDANVVIGIHKAIEDDQRIAS
jgi:hypothetical protein